MFGQPITGGCPLTVTAGDGAEPVCVKAPKMREINVEAIPPYSTRTSKDGQLRCYRPGSE